MEKVKFNWGPSLEDARNGKPEAQEFIYCKLYPIVYKVAFSHSNGNRQDAEDLTQEIFLNIFLKLDQVRTPEAFVTWARKVAESTSISEVKKQVRRKNIVQIDSLPDVSDEDERGLDKIADSVRENPEEELDHLMVAELLNQIFHTLPEMEASCFTMWKDGYSGAEIADALDISQGSVKTNIYHAKQRVKKQVLSLEKQGVYLYEFAPVTFFCFLLYLEESYLDKPEAGLLADQEYLRFTNLLGEAQKHAAEGAVHAKNQAHEGTPDGNKPSTSNASFDGDSHKDFSYHREEPHAVQNSAPAAKAVGRKALKQAGVKAAAEASSAGIHMGSKAIAIIAACSVGAAGVTVPIAIHNRNANPVSGNGTQNAVVAESVETNSGEEETQVIAASSNPEEVVNTSSSVEISTAFEQFYGTYEFLSGVGGWRTELTLNKDGTFTGTYTDSEMGDNGSDYPKGSVYICNFTGKFSEPQQVDEYSWNMTLESLDAEGTEGDSYIEDGVRYIYSYPYGIDGGINFSIYTPGKDISDMDTLRSWMSGPIGDYSINFSVLPCYCIYNNEQEEGFFSWRDPRENGTYVATYAVEGDTFFYTNLESFAMDGDDLVLTGSMGYFSDLENGALGLYRELVSTGEVPLQEERSVYAEHLRFPTDASTQYYIDFGSTDNEAYSRDDFNSYMQNIDLNKFWQIVMITMKDGVVSEVRLSYY